MVKAHQLQRPCSAIRRRNSSQELDCPFRLGLEVSVDAQPIEQDAVLSRAEVAAMLCVGPKTVTRWAKAGKLNSFRTPGGARRFLKADVLTLMTGVKHTHDGSHDRGHYRSPATPRPRRQP